MALTGSSRSGEFVAASSVLQVEEGVVVGGREEIAGAHGANRRRVDREYGVQQGMMNNSPSQAGQRSTLADDQGFNPRDIDTSCCQRLDTFDYVFEAEEGSQFRQVSTSQQAGCHSLELNLRRDVAGAGVFHGVDCFQGKEGGSQDGQGMQERSESLSQAEQCTLRSEEVFNLHRDDDASTCQVVERFQYLRAVQGLQFSEVSSALQSVVDNENAFERVDSFHYTPVVEEGLQFSEVSSALNAVDNMNVSMESEGGSQFCQIDTAIHAGNSAGLNFHRDEDANVCRVENFGYLPVVEYDLRFNHVANENVSTEPGSASAFRGGEMFAEGATVVQTFDFTHLVEEGLQLSPGGSGLQAAHNVTLSKKLEDGLAVRQVASVLKAVENVGSSLHRDEGAFGVGSVGDMPMAVEVLQFDQVASSLESIDNMGLNFTRDDDANAFQRAENFGYTTSVTEEGSQSSQVTGARQALDNVNVSVESQDCSPSREVAIVQASQVYASLNFHRDGNANAAEGVESVGCMPAREHSLQPARAQHSVGNTGVSTESVDGSQFCQAASPPQPIVNISLNIRRDEDANASEGVERVVCIPVVEDLRLDQVSSAAHDVDNENVAIEAERDSTSRQGDPSGFGTQVFAEATRGHAQRSAKHHLGNGVHVLGDTRNNVKGAEKLPWDAKSGGEGQQEGGVPVWVKWRGKWQAAIRCCTIDCPSTILKVKPNYSKKKHVVVYFPVACMFAWVDMHHTCPISEDPLPLFAGTHASGRETVKDENLPRQRMLLKLGGDMLDISDRLHIKAVVESSRNVNVWKTFAKEAAAATKYSELGTLLVRLHLAIVALYIKPVWMERRYGHWKDECAKAATAANLQKLTKELINAVMWEEVAPLWNAPEQPELDPEWAHWKGEAFEEKDSEDDVNATVIKPSATENGTVQEKQCSVGSGSKRFKEQARARGHNSQIQDTPESSQFKRFKVNPSPLASPVGPLGSNFGHAVTAFRSPLVHPAPVITGQQTRVIKDDQCDEVLLRGSNVVVNNEAVQLGAPSEDKICGDSILLSTNALATEAYDSGLCSAFLKKKNRRCHRQSKDETTYCGKHKYLENAENGGKDVPSEGVAWESGLCSAYLKRECTRCMHPTRDGYTFCDSHTYLDKRVQKDGMVLGCSRKEQADFGKTDLASPSKEARCNGITTRGVRCTHKPKDGASFCVKHSTQGAALDTTEECKAQTPEGSAVKVSGADLQHAIDNRTGLTVPVGQASTHNVSPTVLVNGLVQSNITTVAEMKSVENDGVSRKRKWLHNLSAIDKASVPPVSSSRQEVTFPKVVEGRANQGIRCIGRTTRTDDQCSFRARAGYAHCTKHLLSIQGRRKTQEDDVLITDSKVSSSTPGAKDLFERYLKAAEGIASKADHGSDLHGELLKSTRAEASKDYDTAKELLKLVTVEMSRVQTILQSYGEKKEEVKMGLSVSVSGNGILPFDVPENGEVGLESRPVRCGICDVEFPGTGDLGRHWQYSHRKEVSLFVKGLSCRACGRLYARRHTVRRHWKKRHPSLPLTPNDWSIVCLICELQYSDNNDLLEHLISVHSDLLSSSRLKGIVLLKRVGVPEKLDSAETLECGDCHEEFKTHWDLFHHKESDHKKLGTEVNDARIHLKEEKKPGDMGDLASQSMSQMLECCICGKKFSLLSDLENHQQAQHPSSTEPETRPVGPSAKKSVNAESSRMKLPIRRKADEKVTELEASLGDTRRRKRTYRFSKHSHKESNEKDAEIGKEALLLRMKAAVQTAQLRNLRQLKRGEASVTQTRKGLYTLTKGGRMVPYDDGELKREVFPDDSELLDMIQSVCCRSQLFVKLRQKFTEMSDQLSVRVSQLCSEANIELKGEAEGYNCPSGCKESSTANEISQPLVCDTQTSLTSEGTKLSGKTTNDELGKCSLNSEQESWKSNALILCSDLSDGQEPVPVVCFVDEDVVTSWTKMHDKDGGSSSETLKPWDSFNYITKRVLDPSLGLDPENSKVGCSCEGQCSPRACDHVHIFDNDNVEACDIYGKAMKGRFPYDEQGCIILEEGYLVYECNSSCRCPRTCQNRVLQKGVTVKLEVFRTLQKGWAVRAAQMIPRGTFVCEYVGEVLHDQEANKRGERYDQEGCSYLYDIDAHLDTTGVVGRSKPFVIDATNHGNVARFINHSCAPNLVNYQVLVDSMDCQLAHIGLFASRDIGNGEELAYDYRYRLLPGRGFPCHCGAPNCRGRLY